MVRGRVSILCVNRGKVASIGGRTSGCPANRATANGTTRGIATTRVGSRMAKMSITSVNARAICSSNLSSTLGVIRAKTASVAKRTQIFLGRNGGKSIAFKNQAICSIERAVPVSGFRPTLAILKILSMANG